MAASPPAVTKVVAARGPVTGGSAVKLTGTGLDGATNVTFGGVPALGFRVADGQPATSVDVIAPPHKTGTVPITVTTPAGTSPAGTAATFTYQAVHGRWSPVAARQRFFHTATLLADGKVLVAGGCVQPQPSGRCSAATATAEIYDPARRTWTNTPDMTVARVGHLATLLPDGRVLVSGGCAILLCSGPEGAPSGPILEGPSERSAEIYDPRSGQWTPTGSKTLIQHLASATLLPTGPAAVCGPNCGNVLVVGTAGAYVGQPAPTSNAELYDPASGTWALTAATEHARDNTVPPTVLLRNGKVLVAGAVTDLPTGTAVPAELFDPATATWAPTGNAEPFPSKTPATMLADGRVLILATDPSGDRKGVEIYDPTARPDPANPAVGGGAWSITPAPTDLRSANTATLLHDGTVLAVGGNAKPPLPTAELYSEKTAAWTSAATMAGGHGADTVRPTVAASFTATLLNDGTVLIVGPGYATAHLDTYLSPQLEAATVDPVVYGPNAELYTPSRSKSNRGLLALGLGVGGAVLLIAIGSVVLVRRAQRRNS